MGRSAPTVCLDPRLPPGSRSGSGRVVAKSRSRRTLNTGKPRPTIPFVTSGSVSPNGATATAADAARAAQVALQAELIDTMIQRSPSLDHLLGVLERHLSEVAGLSGATVYSLESDSGRPLVAAGLG